MHYKPYIQNLPAYKSPKLTRQQPTGIVKLSSNENPLGPSPKAMAALQAAISEIHRYPDAGAVALRSALAERHTLSPDMVMCTNGSDEAVLLLCLALLREGDEVVMAEGTFISYLIRSLVMGAKPVRVPLNNYAHDLPALAAAVTPRTRIVFVCNPNNPTGTTNGAAEVEQLLATVPDDVLVVLDEAYVEFVERPDYPDALAMLRAGRKNVIALRTFAKIHGLAGLRLGYAFGPTELIGYLERARPVFNVNSLAQVAGLAALDDDEHIHRSREHAQACRAFFERELRALDLEPIPSETNFIAVRVGGDDQALAAAVLEHGFTINPIGGWGLPGHIRISFGLEEENERFMQVFRTVLRRE
jgi:histidinol-phosphate aminotransferase